MAREFEIKLRVAADGKTAITEVNRVGQSLDGLGKKAAEQERAFGSLGRAGSAAMAALAGVVGTGALAASFMAVNQEAGRLRGSLETVTGSASAAASAWSSLTQFAAETPYALAQSVEGFIKLKALGLDPSMEALRSYGNTASAMGKDLNQMIEAVADASAGEFERLKEFGIKASQQGDQVSLTFQGVTTTIAKSAEEIQAYLLSIGDVQFAGAMERPMQTLGGAVSNLGDSWSNLMVALGDTGLTDAVAGAIRGMADSLSSATASVTGFGEALRAGDYDGYIDVFVGMAGAVGGITAAYFAAIIAINTKSAALAALSAAQAAFNALARANPYILLATVIAGAAGALYALRDRTIEVGNITTTVGAQIVYAWDLVWSGMVLGVETFAANFQALFGQLPIIAQQVWSAIANAAVSAMRAIQIAVADGVGYVAGKLASLAGSMADFAASIPSILDIGGAASSMASALREKAAALQQVQGAGADLRLEAELDLAIADEKTEALRFESAAIIAARDAAVDAAEQKAAASRIESTAAMLASGAQIEAAGATQKSAAAAAAAIPQVQALGAALGGKGGGGSGGGKPSVSEGAKAAEAELRKLSSTAESLIGRYLPARKAAEDYAEAELAVADAVSRARISQEEGATILERMREEQAKLGADAKTKADVFAVAWERAVERIDDGFASLWEDLFTGSKNAMDAIKTGLKRWLAEVAHMLTTQKLTLAIGASVTGAGGSASAAGTQAVGSFASTALDGLGKAVSSITSGAIFSGIKTGFGLAAANIGAAGYFGGFGATMTAAGSSFASGAIGTAIGMAAPYLLPLAGLAALAGGMGLFGGKKEDPRITLGVNNGTMGIKGTNGRWDDNGDVGAVMKKINEDLDAIGNALGQGARDARAAYQHPGQELTPENIEKWITDVYSELVRSMVEGAKNENIANAGSKLMGDILTSAFEAAGDDPEAMLAAIGAAKQMHEALYAIAETVFDFDNDPVIGDADRAAQILWDLANSMAKAGEDVAQSLGRIGTALSIANDAFELTGQTFDEIQLSPEELFKTVVRYERAPGAEDATPISDAQMFIFKWMNNEKLLAAAQKSKTASEELVAIYEERALTEAEIEELLIQKRIEIGEKLAEYAGGAEILQQGMAAYYKAFFSEAEQRERMFKQAESAIKDALKGTGMTLDELPGSREELRALVEAQDLTTEAGQRTFAALMSVAGALDYFYAYLDELGDIDKDDPFAALRTSLRDLADELDPQTAAVDRAESERVLADAGYTGEFESAAIAEFLRALAEMDDAGGEAAKSLLDMSDAILRAAEEAARVAEERAGLDLRLLQLTGSATEYTAEVRRRELEGLDESNRALQERIWALEDEAALTKATTDLNIRLAELEGRSEDALRMRREMEIEATDESLRELLMRIYALEDEARALKAIQDAANDAYRALERAVAAEREQITALYDARIEAIDREREAQQSAHDAALEAINTQREAAQEALGEAQGVLSSVQGALSQIRGAAPVDEMSRARAERQLSGMANSRGLPDADQLDRVLAILSRTEKQDFANEAAYQIAQKRTEQNLAKLEKTTQGQVDSAQRQLDALDSAAEAEQRRHEQAMGALDDQAQAAADWRDAELERLDDILEGAKAQLDALMGIDNSLLSIDEAMRRFLVAVGQDPAVPSPTRTTIDGDVPNDGIERAMSAPTSKGEATNEISELRKEVALLRKDMAAVSTAQVVPLRAIEDRLKKWDLDGLPPTSGGDGSSETITLLRAG